MQEYLIEPLQFYHFIVKWNIDTIFHANTLATSCTYFQHDNIMSRECVEQNGLWQTTQMSDDIDKDYGIWNDLFFDSVDICERSGNPNYYGPILFGFSIDLFKDPAIQSVKITRYNPTKWDQVDEERRYFKNTEYQNDMIYGNFDHMITLQCTNGKLELSPHLKTVKIDSPNLDVFGDVEIYSYCRGAIRHAIFDSKKFKGTKFIKRMTGPSLVRDYEKLSEVDLKKKYLIPGV